MVKKIKKYLKFVVCCALILSLIAPSYAALSASDGSAFVTKAEFDSALADFNARLTTFEAGINSKIDSQVSSYLDRNGIWNGKSQIEDTFWTFSDMTTQYYNNVPPVDLRVGNNTTWFRRALTGNMISYVYFTKTWIPSITKTGLLVWNTETWKQPGSDMWCVYSGIVLNNWSGWGKLAGGVEVNFYLGDDVPRVVENSAPLFQIRLGETTIDPGVELNGSNLKWGITPSASEKDLYGFDHAYYINFPYLPGRFQQCQAFVRKDDKVSCCIMFYVDCGQTNAFTHRQKLEYANLSHFGIKTKNALVY